MALKVNTILVGVILLGTQTARSTVNFNENDYLTIDRIEVREISNMVMEQHPLEYIIQKDLNSPDLIKAADSINTAGQVIKVAKDLVALGEDIYKLVQKGKPTNTTTYAPISVIPKIDDKPVDILETEFWKAPVMRTYSVRYINPYRMDVVKYRYSLIFAYGGTYDGKGAYLTAIQVVPESVETLFGYDFTATMKLGGIQNNGTRENPVAAATILMEYTVNTVMKAITEVATFYVTGEGEFKKY